MAESLHERERSDRKTVSESLYDIRRVVVPERWGPYMRAHQMMGVISSDANLLTGYTKGR